MEAPPKTPQGTRATDRVLDALSTLAELLDRSINEVKALDSDFHNRLLQAVHDTESSIQDQAAQHLQTALAETRAKLEDQFTAKMAELSAGWDAERGRLNTELERLSKTAAQWETERKRLNGEIERLAQMQAATQAQAEKAMAAAKAAATTTAKPGGAPAVSEALTKEIDRVEGLIHQIAALMDDASTDLATVIRKNVEKAELESYLKGIRFALNGGSAK
jgi:chromosome segregation ATPase